MRRSPKCNQEKNERKIAVKEIIELNARILTEVGDHLPEDGVFIVTREGCEELKSFPDRLRNEVLAFCGKLDGAVPNDFGYMLFIGCDAPGLRLEYRDGATCGYVSGRTWKSEMSIFEQLKEVDWDKERGDAISAARLFDQVIPMAKNMPVRIPSTKGLQRCCRKEVKDFIKRSRGDASKVHVLFFQGGDGASEDFENMEAFRHALPDMMTGECHIIAVVANGKPLSVEKIDVLKKAALKELEDMPISHAKASGKYGIIMAKLFGQKGVRM